MERLLIGFAGSYNNDKNAQSRRAHVTFSYKIQDPQVPSAEFPSVVNDPQNQSTQLPITIQHPRDLVIL